MLPNEIEVLNKTHATLKRYSRKKCIIDQTLKYYQFYAIITIRIDTSINLNIHFCNAEKEQQKYIVTR